MGELLAPYGFDVDYTEYELGFRAPSAEAFVDAELADHPMWVLARDQRGDDWPADEVREHVLAVFDAANEDPAAFRVSSTYAVIVANRITARP
jgi:hypothetical protein